MLRGSPGRSVTNDEPVPNASPVRHKATSLKSSEQILPTSNTALEARLADINDTQSPFVVKVAHSKDGAAADKTKGQLNRRKIFLRKELHIKIDNIKRSMAKMHKLSIEKACRAEKMRQDAEKVSVQPGEIDRLKLTAIKMNRDLRRAKVDKPPGVSLNELQSLADGALEQLVRKRRALNTAQELQKQSIQLEKEAKRAQNDIKIYQRQLVRLEKQQDELG